MRLRVLLPAALFALAAGRAGAVEYGLTYLSVPGRIDFVQTDLPTGDAAPQTDTTSFGAFGFVAVVPIPGAIGPFSPAVETGFALPAGDQAFDHRELARNSGGSTHNARHDGDFTSWSVATVPVLAAIRYSQPSENVTFGGEVGAGILFMGVSTERTLTTYDASDTTVIAHDTRRSQTVQLALAVQAAAGLVVPATEGVDLRLYGGLIWIGDVPSTTTSDVASPILVYGEDRNSPGLTIGGLGFMLRLALNVSL
ncbi:MAG: hypothetical protein AAB152_11255 [Candidatus Coatesbacteria bacterium]